MGIVCSIEYDPNRNCLIAAVYEIERKKFIYIIAPNGLSIGDILESGKNVKPTLGNSLPLSEISLGSCVHNVSTNKYKKAQISRAAGTFSIITEKQANYSKLQVNSGKEILISNKSYCTIGNVSNEFFFVTKKGKAGRSRWLNQRPNVRGVAMNPVDHPNGGGEGKKSGKKVTPWGKTKKSKK